MLGRVDGPILLEDEAELLDIIRCKVLGLPVPRESSTGMPASQLSALSLWGLLSLIRTLAKFHLQLENVKRFEDPQSAVTSAAYVLRSFPANFHKLLWTIGKQHVPKRCSSVGSQFRKIDTAIFQHRVVDPPETLDFLRIAFLDFAIKQWRRGVVETTLLHRLQKSIPKRVVSGAEFCERYGIAWNTAERVLAIKSIPTITIRTRRTNRILIDLEKFHEPPTVLGRIYRLETAAAEIGVSKKTLMRLRASGHFEVKYLIKRYGYHECDIKQFIERLLALNPSTKNMTLPRDCITLDRAMRRYHGTSEGAASLIRALLSGELRVLGNVDGTVRGLFVSQAEFHQLGMNERARQNSNARTPSEVAEEIHCDEEHVRGLVAARLLDGWRTAKSLRISEQSIARFKEKYVPLVSIAREIGNSPRDLRGYCAAKHIPMVLVKGAYHDTRQAFVRLKDRDAVLSFRPSVNWCDPSPQS